jgi:glycine oxidase
MTAVELRRRGLSVTVLDRGEPGREASWAGGGILSPLLPWDYPDPVNVLALAGMACYPRLAEELLAETGIDPELRPSGMLVLPSFDYPRAEAWRGRFDFAMERCRGRDKLPELAQDMEGLWLPQVNQVRNPRLLHALRRWLEQKGVGIVAAAPVERLEATHGRVDAVVTPQGSFAAANVIVTAGAWSRELLGKQALGLSIWPVRGQMLLFKASQPRFSPVLIKNGIYFVPRDDGHILVGSTLEEAGFDKSTTQEARDHLYREAAALLPFLAATPLVRHWAGLRPGSPGNIPTIDRHPQIANLYLNSGHFRYGVTMAPASAQLLADLLLGTPPSLDPTPYRWPN